MSEPILRLTLDFDEQSSDLAAEIGDAVKEAEHEFHDLFYALASTDDPRLEISSDSMEVKEVELDGDRVSVLVDFGWEVYFGCSDNNTVSCEDVWLEFRLSGGQLNLEMEIPQRWNFEN